jgi:aurora kinase
MSQNVTAMMAGLTIDKQPPPPRPQGERLQPVLKKYMNQDFIRPANTGLAAASSGTHLSQEKQRAAMFKLVGVNSSGGLLSKPSSPAGKGKLSINQHTAHGIHGPAHSTTSRALSGKIDPNQASHQAVAAQKSGIGRYDGGLEADAEGKGVVRGESARILEMQSAYVSFGSSSFGIRLLTVSVVGALSLSHYLNLQSAVHSERVNSVEFI